MCITYKKEVKSVRLRRLCSEAKSVRLRRLCSEEKRRGDGLEIITSEISGYESIFKKTANYSQQNSNYVE